MDDEFGLDRDDRKRNDESALDRLLNNATEIAGTLITGTWLLLLFFGPGNLWLAVLLVGYIVVLPMVEMLAGEDDGDAETADEAEARRARDDTDGRKNESDQDPLQDLRMRYARGELTDEQFERKVEKLLETETIEDVEDRFGQRDQSARERETEME